VTVGTVILPDVRFEVFIVVKIHVGFFWVMMLCGDIVGYQHFRGPHKSHICLV